jgi:hypothetical protein
LLRGAGEGIVSWGNEAVFWRSADGDLNKTSDHFVCLRDAIVKKKKKKRRSEWAICKPIQIYMPGEIFAFRVSA